MTRPYIEKKIFNDPIHGHIELHPLCMKIVDTQQFQRMRYIKQLGTCYLVCPGASHSRFEHSLGVAHLAGRLVREIRHKQPELDITDEDVLCVEIAGLCHDLGHGPYSHMFSHVFMPKVRNDIEWNHEQMSVRMFDYLKEDNNLNPEFERYGLTGPDRTFIKEQIGGPMWKGNSGVEDWPYKGREQNKGFLYEIVANKRNGIDVNKWDNVARDCHHLGITNTFNHERFMKFARVLTVQGDYQIATREKEVTSVHDMFHTRQQLYTLAYHHKTKAILEMMLTEALVLADPYLKFEGRDGKKLRMSETFEDMVAFSKLTDRVIENIYYSDDKDLAEAREIVSKVYRRDLYKFVGQTKPTTREKFFHKADIPSMKEEISNADKDLKSLETKNLRLRVVGFDYGKEEENPVDHMRFYVKSKPEGAVKVVNEQVSKILPTKFQDQMLRLYSCKTDAQSMSDALRHLTKWCEEKGHIAPVMYKQVEMFR